MAALTPAASSSALKLILGANAPALSFVDKETLRHEEVSSIFLFILLCVSRAQEHPQQECVELLSQQVPTWQQEPCSDRARHACIQPQP